jgi:hypothetical protein
VTTDWGTVSASATAVGTLVLAVATFSSVRSANRAARSAERALQVGLRPVLFPSRPQDPKQKLRWGDDHWAVLGGGRALLQDIDGVIYLAISLRNVGSGIAVLHGWRVEPDVGPLTPTAAVEEGRAAVTRPDPGSFRVQGIDIYVPPGSEGFWIAAIRRGDDPDRAGVVDTIANHKRLFVDLLYGDQEGGQRTISRFMMSQHPSEPEDWLAGVVRHWYLDRRDPRWV